MTASGADALLDLAAQAVTAANQLSAQDGAWPRRPRIVVLCGSTRFKAEFEAANRDLTLGGRIVLAPGVFGHADGIELDPVQKGSLDDLHLRKIDIADIVLVVNPGGYIGESTQGEIAYATCVGKPVRYTEPACTCGGPKWVAGENCPKHGPVDY